MKVLKFALACGLSSLAFAATTSAETAVGLVGDRTLVLIDTAKATVTKTVEVSGVDKLYGIDVRPKDKQLYGVAADGTVVTIDAATGAATKGVKLEKTIPAGVGAIVDFNPAADKLRFMGTDGTNLRADVETGKVTTDGSLIFLKEDMHAGEKPNIVAAAYSNAFGKPEKTAMYDIDATIVALIQQVVPNDGTLKAIGKLGIAGAKSYAFDIATTADGKNTAWLVADNSLYSVDLTTGMASAAGKIDGAKGNLRDITVLPAM
ncbi:MULTISPECIES: DUF4394 domain-containing protein [Rhodomicrobium]|uniref:DUF4394 domain-containing protein n=1 Tax=Rhodomicrobium TaxID=1068 RepID=UPI000B4A6E35|nr:MULTISPECIES: DUF4394 domain-containing protein [Rhodomicrobium]